MGRRGIRLAGSLGIAAIVTGFALPAASDAEGPREARGSEPFEVIVVRGAGVSRVTGTEDGVIQEEILREDPHPARRASRPPRAPDAGPQVTVIVLGGAEATTGYPLFVGDRRFDRHGFRGHGRNRHPHRVWRTDRSSQRFYHVRSRGRASHGGRPRKHHR